MLIWMAYIYTKHGVSLSFVYIEELPKSSLELRFPFVDYQRRRTAVDELNMRSIFTENDLVCVSDMLQNFNLFVLYRQKEKTNEYYNDTNNHFFFRLKFAVPIMMAVYNYKQEIRSTERCVLVSIFKFLFCSL